MDRNLSGSGFGGRQSSAVLNAFAVLEAVAAQGPGITAQQISSLLELPRATTYKTVNLLVQQEYLVRLPDLSGFALGVKVAELAQAPEPAIVTVRTPLPEAVRATVAELRRNLRGGVHLMGYQCSGEAGASVLVLDADPDVPVASPARLADPQASAAGRLLLADLHRDPATSNRGYAVHIDEIQPRAGCLAVPVRRSDGALLAGLSLATSTKRLDRPEPLVHRLRLVAGRLGDELEPIG
ncbi:helix-turn-helix domain-containing protein [Nocardia colli]|uniref:helix-turn-helix domain-containing protein n=1 Tax=Nocardia colli TaxID=2545717 RepID=UPI0035D7936F